MCEEEYVLVKRVCVCEGCVYVKRLSVCEED